MGGIDYLTISHSFLEFMYCPAVVIKMILSGQGWELLPKLPQQKFSPLPLPLLSRALERLELPPPAVGDRAPRRPPAVKRSAWQARARRGAARGGSGLAPGGASRGPAGGRLGAGRGRGKRGSCRGTGGGRARMVGWGVEKG